MLEFKEYSLRPLERRDAASMARYANNKKVWLNLRDRFPYPYTEEEAIAWIEATSKLPVGLNFGVCTGKECIGGIGLQPGQDVHRKTAELGYWLAEEFWGQGIMSDAVRIYVEYAHKQFGFLRIFAEPFSSNPASGRVLEKAGFVLEGRMIKNTIKDGKVLDSLLYAKTW